MSTTPPPSPTVLPKKIRNAGTMLPTDLALWRARLATRVLDASEAYAKAIDADRARERQAEVGYRLYWLSDTVLGTIDIPAQPSGYAVVGRHESCDVVLEDELAVSLRHVLVRATSLDDGFPVLNVLDLQTGTGFTLSDGTRQHSIGATGPIVFRIGAHSLVALPSTGRFGEVLPPPIVSPGELAPHRVLPIRIAEQRAEDERSACPPSRITVLPHSVDLSHRRSTGVFEGPSPDSPLSLEAEPSTGDAYQVILESASTRVGVRFSVADLEHGVLIGRAEKCADAGLRAILGTTISRVHVLLIREKGCCHLYDVASLVGTYAAGRRVRCLPLRDGGTSAQLARQAGVTLYWRAV